jgi:1-acyl-sn-glycerol-3-phosphate acyltransferase
MIKADHKIWAEAIFYPYVIYILKKSFSNFYLVNDFPSISSDRSLIITPNHISWWDGFFIYYLMKKRLDRKMYLMMLESSLEKFWFFQKIGAFSINPSNSKSIIESFRYSRELLGNENNFLVTYPQGEIEPFEKRPLNLRGGVRAIIKPVQESVDILPIGFKIEYQNKRNPAIFCRFGSLISGDRLADDFDIFAELFYENLNMLSESVFSNKFNEDLF